MDDELAQSLEEISKVTGMTVGQLTRLAVLEFVQSFDLDFLSAKNRVGDELTLQQLEI
jgi:hypothetical protein